MTMKTTDIEKASAFYLDEIRQLLPQPVRFMEVCGTHTVSIFRAGIRQLLPESVDLVSGPGCPVCVTEDLYMDQAIAYASQEDVILATFGDMLKVPGSSSSLSEARAAGADIRIVYSPLDSLAIARQNPQKKVIFLAVGFETTAPTAAAVVLQAAVEQIGNFFVLSAHKLVPPALQALLADPEVHVDGFILPGHVCVVSGLSPFAFLPEQYHMPAVVCGFEGIDILQTVWMLAKQKAAGKALLENAYARVVKEAGNPVARSLVRQVYETSDACWRGIGMIPDSGLKVRKEYERFDAGVCMPLELQPAKKKTACRCGEVLRGVIKPPDCPLFGRGCTPEHAVGACMVSVEGSCAAWYKYGSGRYQYGNGTN